MLARSVRSAWRKSCLRQLSIGLKVSQLSEALPHKAVVRFDKGNIKWSRKDVDSQTLAAAAAMISVGHESGDTVVSMIPRNQPEYHVTQLACARVGLRFAEVPGDVKETALVDILLETNARSVMFNLTHNGRSMLDVMRRVVPELETFNDLSGMPFHSRLYKKLRHCIHTGYDNIDNFYRYKDILLYNKTWDFQVAQESVSDSMPCYVQYDGSGQKVAELSVGRILQSDVCPVGTAMLVNDAYVEI